MHFKRNAIVRLSGGADVGRIDRVVVDPRTKAITDVVVRGGRLFKEDRLVPMELVASADEDGVVLSATARDLETMLAFDPDAYVEAPPDEIVGASPEAAGRLYQYRAGVASAALPGEAQPLPENAVALKEGAAVIASDGVAMGHVEQVTADERTGRATGFLLSQGLVLKEKRFIPITWVEQLSESEVRLLVGSRMIYSLGYNTPG
jgi:uncharacterized protein YrrD